MKGAITIAIVVCFIIILIFSSVFKSIKINKEKEESQWPPHISKCPEYWVVKKDQPTLCVNESGINVIPGTLPEDTVKSYSKTDDLTQFKQDMAVEESTKFQTWDGVSV
tara:strand:- start:1193 stop:1519 length:327 start_codon:yes stop_codon:yes gene_type:complete